LYSLGRVFLCFNCSQKKKKLKWNTSIQKEKKSGNTKEKVEILLFYIKDPLKKEILKRKG